MTCQNESGADHGKGLVCWVLFGLFEGGELKGAAVWDGFNNCALCFNWNRELDLAGHDAVSFLPSFLSFSLSTSPFLSFFLSPFCFFLLLFFSSYSSFVFFIFFSLCLSFSDVATYHVQDKLQKYKTNSAEKHAVVSTGQEALIHLPPHHPYLVWIHRWKDKSV